MAKMMKMKAGMPKGMMKPMTHMKGKGDMKAVMACCAMGKKSPAVGMGSGMKGSGKKMM